LKHLKADVAKAAMDMLPSKASEGDFIGNGLVSKDFTLSGFLFRQGMRVPNRLKVRLEAFPKSIPMSTFLAFLHHRGELQISK